MQIMTSQIDLPRRQFLKTSGKFLAGGLLLYNFPFAFATNSIKVDENDLKLFSQISTILTAKKDLSPELSHQFFIALMQSSDSAAFKTLLKRSKTGLTQTQTVQEVITQELTQNAATASVIRKIIKMWYLGSFDDKTVSSAAYLQSLAWPAFATTPAGVCAGTNWQNQPA
jgi:hypothetical protein